MDPDHSISGAFVTSLIPCNRLPRVVDYLQIAIMEFGELLKELTLVLNALHRRQVCRGGQALSQCFILLSIPYGGIDMSTLSEKLGLDNSTTTRLVDTLEKNELLRRQKGQEDRRVVIVTLTGKGEKLAEEIDSSIEMLGDAVLENLSTDRRGQTKELLEEVLWSLSKEKLKES